MVAYLHGTSTRKVDDLVKALGHTGISKSEVSRICADLDAKVAVIRDRSLADQGFPYVFLDATYCKVRVNHRVVSQAVVVEMIRVLRVAPPRRDKGQAFRLVPRSTPSSSLRPNRSAPSCGS